MKTSSILISEKKKVFKYNPENDVFEWKLDFKQKVSAISRIEDYVFVTTSSNWGVQSTNLINFDSGEKLWTKDEVFYSVHIISDVLIYANKNKNYCGINLKTGKNIFSIGSPFKWWSTPKTMLLNGKFYLYTSKQVFLLNLENGSVSESKLPNKLNLKEISLVLDEFQININNLPSAGGDAHVYMGDSGVADGGGGDAGGGGGGGDG
jgi:hypothetical protein